MHGSLYDIGCKFVYDRVDSIAGRWEDKLVGGRKKEVAKKKKIRFFCVL